MNKLNDFQTELIKLGKKYGYKITSITITIDDIIKIEIDAPREPEQPDEDHRVGISDQPCGKTYIIKKQPKRSIDIDKIYKRN